MLKNFSTKIIFSTISLISTFIINIYYGKTLLYKIAITNSKFKLTFIFINVLEPFHVQFYLCFLIAIYLNLPLFTFYFLSSFSNFMRTTEYTTVKNFFFFSFFFLTISIILSLYLILPCIIKFSNIFSSLENLNNIFYSTHIRLSNYIDFLVLQIKLCFFFFSFFFFFFFFLNKQHLLEKAYLFV